MCCGGQSPAAQLASWQALAADRAAEALTALPVEQAAQLLAAADAQVSLAALGQLAAAQRETLIGALPESRAADCVRCCSIGCGPPAN